MQRQRTGVYLLLFGVLLLGVGSWRLAAVGTGTSVIAAGVVPSADVAVSAPKDRRWQPLASPAWAGAVRTVPALPVRLEIASAGVSAAVIPVGVDGNGQMQVPAPATQVGWWAGGAGPDDPAGTVVVVGHVDAVGQGRGALFGIANLPLGTLVRVATTAGAYRYRVVARRSYLKSALPAEMFATGGPRQLVLVTCGGPFDSRTGHYQDNTVVYALPTLTAPDQKGQS